MSVFSGLADFRTFKSSTWDEKSWFRFRVKPTKRDRDDIAIRTARQGLDLTTLTEDERVEFDRYQKAVREGDRDAPLPRINFAVDAKMSVELATVIQYADRWFGPDFESPSGGLYLKHGVVLDPEDVAERKGATFFPEGQLLPCNADTIALMSSELIDEITTWLSPFLRPRSPEEQASFRDGAGGNPGPRDDGAEVSGAGSKPEVGAEPPGPVPNLTDTGAS